MLPTSGINSNVQDRPQHHSTPPRFELQQPQRRLRSASALKTRLVEVNSILHSYKSLRIGLSAAELDSLRHLAQLVDFSELRCESAADKDGGVCEEEKERTAECKEEKVADTEKDGLDVLINQKDQDEQQQVGVKEADMSKEPAVSKNELVSKQFEESKYPYIDKFSGPDTKAEVPLALVNFFFSLLSSVASPESTLLTRGEIVFALLSALREYIPDLIDLTIFIPGDKSEMLNYANLPLYNNHSLSAARSEQRNTTIDSCNSSQMREDIASAAVKAAVTGAAQKMVDDGYKEHQGEYEQGGEAGRGGTAGINVDNNSNNEGSEAVKANKSERLSVFQNIKNFFQNGSHRDSNKPPSLTGSFLSSSSLSETADTRRLHQELALQCMMSKEVVSDLAHTGACFIPLRCIGIKQGLNVVDKNMTIFVGVLEAKFSDSRVSDLVSTERAVLEAAASCSCALLAVLAARDTASRQGVAMRSFLEASYAVANNEDIDESDLTNNLMKTLISVCDVERATIFLPHYELSSSVVGGVGVGRGPDVGGDGGVGGGEKGRASGVGSGTGKSASCKNKNGKGHRRIRELVARSRHGGMIRVPAGVGIAGNVAQSGEGMVVDDTINCPVFCKEIDKQCDTFFTSSVMCFPIKIDDSLVAVAELLNKKRQLIFAGGESRRVFSALDKEIFMNFCTIIGLCMSCARRSRALALERDKLDKLLSVVRSLASVDIVDEEAVRSAVCSVILSISPSYDVVFLYMYDKGTRQFLPPTRMAADIDIRSGYSPAATRPRATSPPLSRRESVVDTNSVGGAKGHPASSAHARESPLSPQNAARTYLPPTTTADEIENYYNNNNNNKSILYECHETQELRWYSLSRGKGEPSSLSSSSLKNRETPYNPYIDAPGIPPEELKTIIAIPVYFKLEVIGVIECVARKTPGELDAEGTDVPTPTITQPEYSGGGIGADGRKCGGARQRHSITLQSLSADLAVDTDSMFTDLSHLKELTVNDAVEPSTNLLSLLHAVAFFAGIWLHNTDFLAFTLRACRSATRLSSALENRPLHGATNPDAHIKACALAGVSAIPSEEIDELLTTSLSFELESSLSTFLFDVWALRATGGPDGELLLGARTAFDLIIRTGLPEEFGCSERTLAGFILACTRRYRRNPYHSFFHALDVMQMLHTLLFSYGASARLTRLEQFALLIAGLAHDLDHMGLNNSYYLHSSTPWGLLTCAGGSQSVLEIHHCNVLLEILENDNVNVFGGIEKNDQQNVYSFVIEAILRTDMAKHGKTLEQLNEWPESEFEFQNAEQRHFAADVLLKMADISNPVRPFEVGKKWGQAVTEEFFQQGDKERMEGRDVTPMCDRSQVDFISSQLGFYQFVVEPLFVAAVQKLFPAAQELVDNIKVNKEKWTKLKENNEKGKE